MYQIDGNNNARKLNKNAIDGQRPLENSFCDVCKEYLLSANTTHTISKSYRKKRKKLEQIQNISLNQQNVKPLRKDKSSKQE